MILKDYLNKFNLSKLKIKTPILEAEVSYNNVDKKAAWDLYVELLTRITTQSLSPNKGDEKTALDSIYSIFNTTRIILKDNGPGCERFTLIAIIVLNQIIRPFTEDWHRRSLNKAFEDENECIEFRKDLEKLQIDLRNYTKLLSALANVEDLTDINEEE